MVLLLLTARSTLPLYPQKEGITLSEQALEVSRPNGHALATLTERDMSDASLSTFERASILRVPQAREVAQTLMEIKGRPLSDRILVLPLPKDDHYSMIIIPEQAQDDQTCGIVVGVGRGRYDNGTLVAPEVRVGNYVAFSKYSSRKIKIGAHELFQITEQDINFAAGD